MSQSAPTQAIAGLEPADLRWRIDIDVLIVEFYGRRDTPAHMARCWRAVQGLAEAQRLAKILAIDLMDD